MTTQAQSLADLLAGVEVIDLTQPLSEQTPVLKLPEPFANTPGLSRREQDDILRLLAKAKEHALEVAE